MQGLGGAVVSAVALSLMMTLFTEPAERAKAMGVFGFVAAGGGSIGVLLGGVLTDSLNWHWIFLVNVPIGVAVVVALAAAAARRRAAGPPNGARRRRRGHRDGGADARRLRDRQRQPGGLDVAPRRSACSAPRPRCSAVFLVIESRVAAPLVPLGLFRLRNVATANVVGVLWAAAMFAWFFLSALYLQLVLGYSPLAGRARLPAGQPDHGRVLARPLGQARDALRRSAAARASGWRSPPPGCCCSRARRSTAASSSTCCRA